MVRHGLGRDHWNPNNWPLFFQGPVRGHSYLNFLENNLPDLLGDLPLNVRRNMWFQQDGAPAHREDGVVKHLDERFPGRWISIRGPVF